MTQSIESPLREAQSPVIAGLSLEDILETHLESSMSQWDSEKAKQSGTPITDPRITTHHSQRRTGSMPDIPQWQKTISQWAHEKGWRGPTAQTQRTTGDDIALIVSEASEALEAFRDSGDPLDLWYTYTVEVDGVKFKDMKNLHLMVLLDCDSEEELDYAKSELKLVGKPEGVGPELADLMIRVLDYAEHVGLDMAHEIEQKMAHNQTRELYHGGKRL
jgi:NTP pyrophosphatase (non-canonical NTP hydrolase)